MAFWSGVKAFGAYQKYFAFDKPLLLFTTWIKSCVKTNLILSLDLNSLKGLSGVEILSLMP